MTVIHIPQTDTVLRELLGSVKQNPDGLFEVLDTREYDEPVHLMFPYWLHISNEKYRGYYALLRPLPGKEKAALLFLRGHLPEGTTIELHE